MKVSRRDRRDWRIILWGSLASAVVSAFFGIRVGPAAGWWLRSATHGVVISLFIATPIFLLQVRGERTETIRRLRRLPLVLYFAIKVFIYFVVIVGGLLISRLLLSNDVVQYVRHDQVFRQSLVFAIAMSVGGNLLFEMG